MSTKSQTRTDVWMHNTLDRTVQTGQTVYERTLNRRVAWPSAKICITQKTISQDSTSPYVSLDDAFASVIQSLSQTTKCCKRYYTTNEDEPRTSCDRLHCSRFHVPQYTQIHHQNPLYRTEDVHIKVQPGSYAVSLGEWGHQKQQTHVVHVKEGQVVDLDFCVSR